METVVTTSSKGVVGIKASTTTTIATTVIRSTTTTTTMATKMATQTSTKIMATTTAKATATMATTTANPMATTITKTTKQCTAGLMDFVITREQLVELLLMDIKPIPLEPTTWAAVGATSDLLDR